MLHKRAILLLLICSHLAAEELSQIEITSIQNKTIPTVLYKYQTFNAHDTASTITARLDNLWSKSDWTAFLRFELPFIFLQFLGEELFQFDDSGLADEIPFANVSSPTQKKVQKTGLGDLLVQFLWTFPPIQKWSFELGPEVVFPTATEPDLGTGCYLFRPVFTINYDLQNWSPGSWASFLTKYQFAVGDEDPSRLSVLYLEPSLNIGLPAHYFFNIASEMQWSASLNRWFIPLALLLGRTLHEKMITTIEYQVGLLRDYPVMSQKVEVSLGWIF